MVFVCQEEFGNAKRMVSEKCLFGQICDNIGGKQQPCGCSCASNGGLTFQSKLLCDELKSEMVEILTGIVQRSIRRSNEKLGYGCFHY